MPTSRYFQACNRANERARLKALTQIVEQTIADAAARQGLKPPQVRDPFRPARVVHAYTVQHLTGQQIGAIEGISRSAVHHILRKAGVNRSDGTWVDAVCYHCQKPFKAPRARWRKARHVFCSNACYFAKRRNPAYRPHRQGQRIARVSVRAAGFPLLKSHVVHHFDGDNKNNAINNLAVFASQRDHLRFHHHGQPDPIWDGRNIRSLHTQNH